MILLLLGAVSAGARGPGATQKTRLHELRETVRIGKQKLKTLDVERHKELVLIIERELAERRSVKASAALPETIHAGLHEVHEKWRRQRLDLRARVRDEGARLREMIRRSRAEIAALRQKR